MANNIDIDLNGWDTAFVISLAKANEAIHNTSSTPSSFNQQNILSGNWDTWKFTTNGGGQIIQFACPVKSGKYTGPGTIDMTVGIDLTALSFTVQCQLQAVSNDIAQSRNITVSNVTSANIKAGTGQQNNLVIRLDSNDPKVPPVSVIGSNLEINQEGKLINSDTCNPISGVDDPFMAKTMIEAYVTKWFKSEGLAAFKHVFTEFLVGAQADKDDFAWLLPTDISYAVAMPKNPTLDNSVLGVMAMTEHRSPSNVSNQIDGRLLALMPNSDSVFAISGERFVEKWLLRGAINCHVGSTATDFAYTDDQLTVYNRANIKWGKFQASGNSFTDASVGKGNFRIGLSGDSIQVSFTDIQWDWDATWGQTVHANYSERYQIELKSGTDSQKKTYKNVLNILPYQLTDKEGKKSAENPIITFTTTETELAKWEKIGIDIAVSIAGSIVGGVVAGKLAGSAGRAVAEAAAQGGEQAAVNVGRLVGELAAEGSSAAASRGGSQTAAEGLSEVATNGLAKAGAWLANKATSFGQFLFRIRWTLLGSVIGGAVGAAVGDIPRIIEAANYDNLSDIPSFNDFAGQAVASIQWPANGGFQLTDAKLAGALILGGTLTNIKS